MDSTIDSMFYNRVAAVNAVLSGVHRILQI